MTMKKVLVNVPFKVAGGKYYDQAGKIELMTDDEIKRALAVNPNMITVLPTEEKPIEETESVEDVELEQQIEEIELIEETESVKDTEPVEKPKKANKAKK